jgi:hypothetical protein
MTTASGLEAPSLPFVGWGTQFLDADLDGAPDLVVLNGHVDDYRDVGGAYAMRPQVFRNLGTGRFVELTGDAAGAFFDRPRVGRALARLDWNGDGRMDLVESCLVEPAVLLTNSSPPGGRFLQVRLRGRSSSRDALGAVVDVRVGDRTWRKQLVGGDGFHCSNERLLAFGLGPHAAPVDVHVLWPAGGTSRISAAPVDSRLDIHEESSTGVLWRGSSPAPLKVAYDAQSGASTRPGQRSAPVLSSSRGRRRPHIEAGPGSSAAGASHKKLRDHSAD